MDTRLTRMRTIRSSLLGGLWAGVAFHLLPRHGWFSEAGNFHMFLLEVSYQVLSRWLPPSAMRALSTAWGELAILAALGAVIGLGIGVSFSGTFMRVNRRWALAPALLALSSTAGVLACLGTLLWVRVVMVHASLRRMVSWEGLALVGLALGVGLVIGFALFAVLRQLWRLRALKVGFGIALAVMVLASLVSDELVGSTAATLGQRPGTAIRQIVLVGADGATWDVALPLIKEGKLPHLARLMERGAWGDIRSTLPWKSPILWASIGTGKREDEHGIHDFVVRDEDEQALLPVSVASRKVKSIWDIASESGFSVNVINWYASWPVEPLRGTMVSDRFLLSELSDRVFPADRTAELDGLVQQLAAQGLPRDETMVAEVGLALLARDQPDLHVLYLRQIDHTHHFFFRDHALRRGSRLARWLYGSIEPAELAERGPKIEQAYRQLDAVLGRLSQLIGPQTAILVVSDHGGGIKAPGKLRFTLDPVLEALGFLRYQPDGKTIDWTATKVYDSTKQSWNEQRELFINHRPEGPFGGTANTQIQAELASQILRHLQQLKARSGQSVVTNAWVVEESDGAPVHLVARLNVRLNEHDVIQLADGQQPPISRILWHASWTGTHRLPGIIVMAGPGIKSGYRLTAASILDVTPTLLYFMGLPVADDMEGRPLLEAIEPAVRNAKPLQWVATYETGNRRVASPAQPSAADEELLEQLRSLGYIQ